MSHCCEFCLATLSTLQGVNSHIFQSPSCREKFLAKYSTSPAHVSDGLGQEPYIPLEAKEHPQFNHDPLKPPNAVQDFPEPAAARQQRRVSVEDVLDEDECWVEDYPGLAGAPYGYCQNTFSKRREKQEGEGHTPWYPFESESEWGLARWLMTSGVSQTKMDSFLKLQMIREGAKPVFHNARSLLQRIDALPRGPEWTCTVLRITGDEKDAEGNFCTEDVELWHRNPVECVQELIENPVIGKKNTYAPCRVYRNQNRTNREYGEMNTGNWSWETQKKLPAGATLVPVILSSDKTNLTTFSGDKQAYPVYLGIGVTEHEIQRQPSAHAMLLVGYIPVSKLECFSAKQRAVEGYQLFHECMRTILKPLIDAGENGIRMNCADGFVRMVYPIVAAYVADYPEQCLVAACKENACPKCTVSPKQRGDPVHSVLQDPEKTLHTLTQQSRGEHPVEFIKESLRPIDPFWKDLPHCNIFGSITPDILHQLHKGVFKDHLVSWASEAVPGGTEEVDRRFRAMTHDPTLRHFKKGVSLTTQWTGTEHKNMEKVFLSVLANATDPGVIRAVRGVLDFIYYAHFEVHTEESLAQLDAAWVAFHENKKIFEDLDIRKHFNISKIHNIKHYLDSIRELGSAAGFNTEATERLHIDLAKVGYRATNKKAYIKQMTVWLRRWEAVERFGLYLQWIMPGYTIKEASSLDGDGEDEDDGSDDDGNNEDNDEDDTRRPKTSVTSYRVAKNPALPRVTVQSIVHDFGAKDFLTHLTSFLRERSIPSHIQPSDLSTFPVYHHLHLSLPAIREISTSCIKDTIIATKAEHGKVTTHGIMKGKPATRPWQNCALTSLLSVDWWCIIHPC